MGFFAERVHYVQKKEKETLHYVAVLARRYEEEEYVPLCLRQDCVVLSRRLLKSGLAITLES